MPTSAAQWQGGDVTSHPLLLALQGGEDDKERDSSLAELYASMTRDSDQTLLLLPPLVTLPPIINVDFAKRHILHPITPESHNGASNERRPSVTVGSVERDRSFSSDVTPVDSGPTRWRNMLNETLLIHAGAIWLPPPATSTSDANSTATSSVAIPAVPDGSWTHARIVLEELCYTDDFDPFRVLGLSGEIWQDGDGTNQHNSESKTKKRNGMNGHPKSSSDVPHAASSMVGNSSQCIVSSLPRPAQRSLAAHRELLSRVLGFHISNACIFSSPRVDYFVRNFNVAWMESVAKEPERAAEEIESAAGRAIQEAITKRSTTSGGAKPVAEWSQSLQTELELAIHCHIVSQLHCRIFNTLIRSPSYRASEDALCRALNALPDGGVGVSLFDVGLDPSLIGLVDPRPAVDILKSLNEKDTPVERVEVLRMVEVELMQSIRKTHRDRVQQQQQAQNNAIDQMNVATRSRQTSHSRYATLSSAQLASMTSSAAAASPSSASSSTSTATPATTAGATTMNGQSPPEPIAHPLSSPPVPSESTSTTDSNATSTSNDTDYVSSRPRALTKASVDCDPLRMTRKRSNSICEEPILSRSIPSTPASPLHHPLTPAASASASASVASPTPPHSRALLEDKNSQPNSYVDSSPASITAATAIHHTASHTPPKPVSQTPAPSSSPPPLSLSADDLLPLFVYILLHSSPHSLFLHANLAYMRHFLPTSRLLSPELSGELAYRLANFEAAMSYIQSGKLKESLMEKQQQTKGGNMDKQSDRERHRTHIRDTLRQLLTPITTSDSIHDRDIFGRRTRSNAVASPSPSISKTPTRMSVSPDVLTHMLGSVDSPADFMHGDGSVFDEHEHQADGAGKSSTHYSRPFDNRHHNLFPTSPDVKRRRGRSLSMSSAAIYNDHSSPIAQSVPRTTYLDRRASVRETKHNTSSRRSSHSHAATPSKARNVFESAPPIAILHESNLPAWMLMEEEEEEQEERGEGEEAEESRGQDVHVENEKDRHNGATSLASQSAESVAESNHAADQGQIEANGASTNNDLDFNHVAAQNGVDTTLEHGLDTEVPRPNGRVTSSDDAATVASLPLPLPRSRSRSRSHIPPSTSHSQSSSTPIRVHVSRPLSTTARSHSTAKPMLSKSMSMSQGMSMSMSMNMSQSSSFVPLRQHLILEEEDPLGAITKQTKKNLHTQEREQHPL